MREDEIFNRLFEGARRSKDPEGVVAACLVKQDEIVVEATSSDDGSCHAEYLVIQAAMARGVPIDADDVLYTTLEPCSDLPTVNDGIDCVTCLIKAGVKHIVFAARDPEYSLATERRLRAARISARQIGDPSIVRRAIELFNSTIRVSRQSMRLPRQRELPAADS